MISLPRDPLHSLSPETRLLLGCNSTGVLLPTQLCPEIVNWQKLLRSANSYDLAPLLYLNLKMSVGSDLIPTSVSERLETIYKRSCVEVMNAFVKLEEILSTFSRAGIPAIVLKGAALTALVYRRMGLRPMVDIDLLVRKKDLDRAALILSRLGYFPDESYHSQEWYKDQHHHLAPYIVPDRSLGLELHHHVISPASRLQIPIDEFWRRARPTPIASVPALVLSPEDILISLCLHGSINCFSRVLRDLVDITEVIRLYLEEINWDRLSKQARTYEVAKSVFYSLWLAERFTGAAVPPHVLQRLESALETSRLESGCLKFLIPRAVFPELSTIPPWLITGVIAKLMSPDTARTISKGGVLTSVGG